MKKQPEVTAKTRSALVYSFWELYCYKKIEHITVKEITDAAGFNRGTFYVYFKDVYDILGYIENSLLPNASDITEGALEERKKKRASEDAMSMFVKEFEKKGKYLSVLLGPNGDPSFSLKIKNRMKPMMLHVRGRTETGNIEQMEYVLEYALSSILGTLTFRYEKKENQIPVEELVTLIHKIMQTGVTSYMIGNST